MPNEPTHDTAHPRPPEDHPDHADWLVQWLGRELKALRVAQDLSAYEVAVPGVLADQTILDNEGGLKNPGLKTLAVHCRLLGTSFPELMRRSWEPR